MERAKLGAGIRKHITTKRHSCVAVASLLSLSVTVSSRNWWCFLLSWKAQHTASSIFSLSVTKPPVTSHGGDSGLGLASHWAREWWSGLVQRERTVKQTMACPSREFGCCAVTSAVLNSRDSSSLLQRTAAVTDGAVNWGCFKHSYSTMYSSCNPPRRLSDLRKFSERIYDYYSQLFY